MKKTIYISILLNCLYQCIYGQQIEFYKHYSSNYEIAFSSIAKVHDGGLIVVGEAFAHNGSNYFYLKTDSLGNELWRGTGTYFTGSLDSSNVLYDVIETVDKRFVMCGVLTTYSPYKEQVFLLCVDSLGAVIWSRFESFPSAYTSARQIIGLSNGDFYTIGNKFDTIPEVYIEKHIANGDTAWTKDLSFYPFFANGLRIINKDNSLFTTGILRDTVGAHTWPFVVKLDTSGNIINTIQLIDSISVQPLNLCLFDSILKIPFIKFPSAGPSSTIVTYDLFLNEINRIDLPSMDFCNFINDSSFMCTMPGIVFHKGDASGDTLWDYFLNEPDGLVGDIIFDSNGCGYASGRIDDGSSSSSTGFIIKICDSLINTTVNPVSHSGDLGVIIFPNPSGRRITIKIPKDFIITSEIQFNLYDSNGKNVYTNRNITDKETIVEFPDLPASIYEYVFSDSKVNLKGKLIIN